MSGTPAPVRSKSSSVRSMPRRPAIASRCTTELVDPPTAATATIALRNDSFVITSLGLRSLRTMSTISRPDSCDFDSSSACAAGVPANPGIVMPSASATTAIVEAVPIVLQCPLPGIIDCSDCRNIPFVIVPARASSLSAHTSVPQPRAALRK